MDFMEDKEKLLHTVDVVTDDLTMIKPSELIECREMAPLTLSDRRIYNMLLLNAWESIADDKIHYISKRDLRGTHSNNDRVRDSIFRLMSVVAQVHVSRNKRQFTRLFHILEEVDDENGDDMSGILYYSFSATLRTIIKNSTQFARLQKEIMFAFSSKYALSLYELVAKRINLKHKTNEQISLDHFRSLLGVEDGKLSQFKHFNEKAIRPAIIEVNGLAEFGCKVEPVYAGRKVMSVKLSWWAKTIFQKMNALREMKGNKIGRKARLFGTSEIDTAKTEVLKKNKFMCYSSAPASIVNLLQFDTIKLRSNTLNKALDLAPHLDIIKLEVEWRIWAKTKKQKIKYPDAAFLAFIRTKIKQHG